jgi:hypothetical protein
MSFSVGAGGREALNAFLRCDAWTFLPAREPLFLLPILCYDLQKKERKDETFLIVIFE